MPHVMNEGKHFYSKKPQQQERHLINLLFSCLVRLKRSHCCLLRVGESLHVDSRAFKTLSEESEYII